MRRKRELKPREDVLAQALLDVTSREETYGDPLINHTRAAILIGAYFNCKPLNSPITPVDIVNIQLLNNIARLIETPHHQGSWENMAGYAAIGYEVAQ